MEVRRTFNVFMNYKARVLKSIENFSRRQITTKRQKKNDKPEAKLVLEIKNHFNNLGWNLTIIESKANYSAEAGRYMHGAVNAGYSDLSGNTSDGIAVFIEVKAPGKRNTIRLGQHNFLIEKISTNCFAVCADSIAYIELVYVEWRKSNNRKAMLLKELPELQPRLKKQLDDDLSFD